jgi:hypothetical protein
MPTYQGFLSEQEVRDRLNICSNETIDDMYAFGQKLEDQALERVRNVERKSTLFAAYGIGIVTLLASTFSTWATPGNRHTLWISVCASACAALCAYFAVDVLRLRESTFTSEDDWLNRECLDDIVALKKYRILTLWETVDSRFRQQCNQAKELRCAELSLTFSGFFLVYLLVQLAFLQLFGHGIERLHGAESGWFSLHWSVIGDIFTLVFIFGTSLWFLISLSGVRSFRFFHHNGENYKSHEAN